MEQINSNNGPRLLMIELNEFDPGYLYAMAEKLNLENLRRVLSLPHSTTWTSDTEEHQGLDPWVQWVGVHCGKPTEVHGVRRLGATGSQVHPQLWHEVAKKGLTWGVWGAMNAPIGSTVGCKFFMPDPWSFDERATPENLNDLLALPRYAAQNYLEMDYRKAFGAVLRLARFFSPPTHWGLLARFGLQGLSAVAAAGPNVHTFATLLDYLSVLYFLRLRKQDRPNLSLIFLNHIAHLQHQFWQLGETHNEMKLGLQLSDAMIGMLLADRAKDEALLLMNGLKQVNVAGQGFHVYRQRNPQRASEALGIEGGRVEQCMTHDATILFEDASKVDHALQILDGCHLSDGHKAFYVEKQSDNRVFYQLSFEHNVSPETKLISGNYSQPFFDVFELICERTGAHVPEGDIYADGIEIAPRIQNHEVFHFILEYFGASGLPLAVAS
jgi:hypothetical protein